MEVVEQWNAMVVAWEKVMTRPCPYKLPDESRFLSLSPIVGHLPSSEVSVATVKQRLAQEDHQEAIKGSIDFSTTNVTPSSFVTTEIELEEMQ